MTARLVRLDGRRRVSIGRLAPAAQIGAMFEAETQSDGSILLRPVFMQPGTPDTPLSGLELEEEAA